MSHPPPSSADWNAWAAFSNEVSRALGAADVRTLFSKRARVAEHLWALGYRPTEAQVQAEIERQRDPGFYPTRKEDA